MAANIKLNELFGAKESLFTHTAESKGYEAKLMCLIWQCVLNEDGSRIWNSLLDFQNDLIKNRGFVIQSLQTFTMFLNGYDEQVNDLEKLFDTKIIEGPLEEDKEKENGTTPVETV